MPTTDEHLQAAERNEKLSQKLLRDGDEYADWALVCLFYAAVHYGRAYIASLGSTALTSHAGFESVFLSRTGDRRLFRFYRRLKDESERARYDCVCFTRAETEELRDRFLKPWRDKILDLIPRNPRRIR